MRDVKGEPQVDRRNAFYKKRSALIGRYSIQLEKKEITARHFVNVMANEIIINIYIYINNEIICHEKNIFTHEIDVRMSVETVLEEGADIPYEEITIEQENIVVAPMATRMKKANNLDETSSQVGKRTRKRKADAVDDAPVGKRTRSKKVANEITDVPQTSKARNTNKEKVISRSKARPKAHVVEDEADSDDDERTVSDVMERINRNGSAMVKLRKRIHELEKQETITCNPDSFQCIIWCERRKNTILFPCLH